MHKILLSCLTVLLLSGVIQGQELTLDQRPLRGLTGFHVIVEMTNNTSAETRGITKNQLQTDVELRLRKAGIRVLTEKEWALSSRTPALYVNLNILTLDRIAEGYYAYSLNIEVKQLVYLQTSPPVETLASTWDKGLAGAAGRDSLEDVRRGLSACVDYLINDYLAANPKR
jgi:hypothetical protein